MSSVVIIDSNLFLLMIVGLASPGYIRSHSRLDVYNADDFLLLEDLIGRYDSLVLLPHILTEVSNLERQGGLSGPAVWAVRMAFKNVVQAFPELPPMSKEAVSSHDFVTLGLGIADAAILKACSLKVEGGFPALITSDRNLASRAIAQGYETTDYFEFRDKA